MNLGSYMFVWLEECIQKKINYFYISKQLILGSFR